MRWPIGVARPTLVRSLFLDWSSMAIGGILTQEPAGTKCGERFDAIEDGGWRSAQDWFRAAAGADAGTRSEAGRRRCATDETFRVFAAYLVVREVSYGSTDASDEAEA